MRHQSAARGQATALQARGPQAPPCRPGFAAAPHNRAGSPGSGLRPVGGALIAAVLLATTTTAHGDQVVTAEENFTKVTVTDYVNGDLHLRLGDNSTQPVPLVEVRRMVIDSVGQVADLNEAERYLEQNEPERAIPRYERALRQASGVWAQIIRVRLLQACDRAGKFEQAVTYFVEVAAEALPVAARLLPTSIPASRTPLTRRALQRVSAEADGAPNSQRRVLMEIFRYAVWDRTDDRRADEQAGRLARIAIPPSIGTAAVYGVWLGACRRLLDAGEHQEVLDTINLALGDCPLEVVPDLLLLKGGALLGRSSSLQDLLRSGSAFMRVAIHFADDERAARGLFWAARVHERLERPDKAAQLLNECLAHARISAALRDRAEAELARLENSD